MHYTRLTSHILKLKSLNKFVSLTYYMVIYLIILQYGLSHIQGI